MAMSEERFYLRVGFCGDCVLFWRRGDHGYTMDLDDAALYSRKEAERRVRPGVDELLSESAVLQAVRRHVDAERLPRQAPPEKA